MERVKSSGGALTPSCKPSLNLGIACESQGGADGGVGGGSSADSSGSGQVAQLASRFDTRLKTAQDLPEPRQSVLDRVFEATKEWIAPLTDRGGQSVARDADPFGVPEAQTERSSCRRSKAAATDEAGSESLEA